MSGPTLPYPILADRDRKIAQAYEMFDPVIQHIAHTPSVNVQSGKDDDDGLPHTVRSVFLVDSAKKLRFMFVHCNGVPI